MIPNNLFPVAASRGKKAINPDHHNAGRVQNFNQRLTSRLSWLHLQLKGAYGNLTISAADFGVNKRRVGTADQFYAMGRDDYDKLNSLRMRTVEIAIMLDILAKDVSAFNKSKARLPKEKAQ